MKVKARLIIAAVIAVVIAAIGIWLLFVPKAFKYGLILLGVVFLAVLIWKAFIQSGQQELRVSQERTTELEKQVGELRERLEEISHSPLNITSLTPVLHLAVMNIDTSFTRTYTRNDEAGGMTFKGALRADICAEYGIRLEDVRFRYDKDLDTLWLADFHPGLLSFSKKQLQWELGVTVRERSLLGIKLPPVDDKAAEAFTREMKESIRAEVEKEIDERRIAEFEWLAPIVSRQVTDVLRATLGRPGAKIAILDSPPASGAGFLPLTEFAEWNKRVEN